MHTVRSWICRTAACICIAAFGNACNDPSDLGTDIVDTPILEVDTLAVTTFNVRQAPYRTDVWSGEAEGLGVYLVNNNVVVGQLRDEHFGTVSAGAFTEIFLRDPVQLEQILDSAATGAQALIRIDSVRMTLDLVSFRGDLETSYELNVFPLLDTLRRVADTDERRDFGLLNNGYTYQDTILTSTLQYEVLDGPFRFPEDSLDVSIFDYRYEFRLDNRLGEDLLQDGFEGFGLDSALISGTVSNADSTDSLRAEAYRNYRNTFPGIYFNLRPTDPTSTGGLFTFDMLPLFGVPSDTTGFTITVFLSYLSKGGLELQGELTFSTSGAFFSANRYYSNGFQAQHFYSLQQTIPAGSLAERLQTEGSSTDAVNLATQSPFGYGVHVRYPERNSTFFNGIATPQIIRAELILSVDNDFYQDSSTFDVFRPDSNFQFYYEVLPGTSDKNLRLGRVAQSFYDTEQDTYVFNLATSIQDFGLGINTNLNYIIEEFANQTRGNRQIFCGPGHPDPSKRPRLVVFYSRPPGTGGGG